jgi:arachidonate 15-lipoxygenase
MNRRDFHRLTLAASSGLLLPGLSGCASLQTVNRLAGVTDYYAVLSVGNDDPRLPGDDPDPGARAAVLEELRNEYRYNHELLSPLAIADSLPKHERFSAEYTAERIANTGYLLPPIAQWKTSQSDELLDHLSDFEKIFDLRKDPASIRTWRTDESFAEQRLSGVNPMRIRRIRKLDEMPFRLDRVPRYGGSTREAIAGGRLYAVDYEHLAFVRGGSFQGVKKHLPRPGAVFYWETGTAQRAGRLMPVAIQIDPSSEVVTPDAANHRLWLLAKIAVQIADANDHEMGSHLGRTHFALTPFVIASARHLAPNHPLGILLRPHFRFLLANDELGVEVLINPGGIADELLAGTIEESMKIAANAAQAWSPIEDAFPRELASRGLDDKDALPFCAYRDDGELVWEAIHTFVSRYIRLYYHSDADVVNDTELRAWAAELASPEHGRVKDMPSPIRDREELTLLATNILFTAGPQHAAVNYPQYDYVAFVPNAPLSAYGPMPDPESADFDLQLVRWLPPASRVRGQYQTMDALTLYRYDQLGTYYRDAFREPGALSLVAAFQQQLHLVERQIDERNLRRVFPYEFLKPSLIPNGTSI